MSTMTTPKKRENYRAIEAWLDGDDFIHIVYWLIPPVTGIPTKIEWVTPLVIDKEKLN